MRQINKYVEYISKENHLEKTHSSLGNEQLILDEEILDEQGGSRPIGPRPKGWLARWFYERRRKKELDAEKDYDQEIEHHRERKRQADEFVHKQKIKDLEQAARHKAELEALEGPKPPISGGSITPQTQRIPSKRIRILPKGRGSATAVPPAAPTPTIPNPTAAAKTLAPPKSKGSSQSKLKPGMTYTIFPGQNEPVPAQFEGPSWKIKDKQKHTQQRIGTKGRGLYNLFKEQVVERGKVKVHPQKGVGWFIDDQGNVFYPSGGVAPGRKHDAILVRDVISGGKIMTITSMAQLRREYPHLFDSEAN